MLFAPKTRKRFLIAMLVVIGLGVGVWWLTKGQIDQRLVGQWMSMSGDIVALNADGTATVSWTGENWRWWCRGRRLYMAPTRVTLSAELDSLVAKLTGKDPTLRIELVGIHPDTLYVSEGLEATRWLRIPWNVEP